MSDKNAELENASSEEELSDYREVLSCMRKRFEGYGLLKALERLERLDAAIFEAILEGLPPVSTRTIN
ncbi:MAG: hypothetical protein WDM89_02405 [Rhizomicrobium sp.]